MTIQYHPISITFGTFELAEAVSSSQRDTKVELVVDPDYNEEAVVAGKITFAMNRQGEVISVIKTGGIGLDPEIIHTKCLNVASKHVQALSNQLDAALKFR